MWCIHTAKVTSNVHVKHSEFDASKQLFKKLGKDKQNTGRVTGDYYDWV